ncbi:uncharacterized protein EDB91DRAFT_182611 [Suillus paluster]|uniref:uncharacterized protein n=1 Tax=Suillus paluster TaxID=48578 RepID=UPI001B88648C|nr:uncharacterized protein EDB91DRAFT_182611 [Suillus paluster]KAG1723188.1 hypothetical protein EDB91DRAFT_182611 [Suillus paluster]
MTLKKNETIEVTLKYGGIKGGRLLSGMTNKTNAYHILLEDLTILKAHRPKGENVRQEGATFFLSWHRPSSLVKDTSLYQRWVAIDKGSPRLDQVKKKLSILPSIDFTRTHGTSLSPLGPKHTIELPRTEGMGSLAEHFSSSPMTERPYSPELFTTEVSQGKRSRSDSINEPLSLSFGSDALPRSGQYSGRGTCWRRCNVTIRQRVFSVQNPDIIGAALNNHTSTTITHPSVSTWHLPQALSRIAWDQQ